MSFIIPCLQITIINFNRGVKMTEKQILKDEVRFKTNSPLDDLGLVDVESTERRIRSVTTTPIYSKKRDNRQQTTFDGRKIFAAVYKSLSSVPHFREDIIEGTPLFYLSSALGKVSQDNSHGNPQDNLQEVVAHELYKAIINRINGAFPTIQTPPDVYQIQDIVTDVLRDSGLTKVVDHYYLYSSIHDAFRRGELTEEQYRNAKKGVLGVDEATLSREREWYKEMKCFNIDELNAHIKNGTLEQLVDAQNRRYEERLDSLTDTILSRIKEGLRILVIAGPSSSGKTWLAKKVERKLETKGAKAMTVQFDNFFWPYHLHPLVRGTSPDYEQSMAIDIPGAREFLYKLLNGEKVVQPVYDFHGATTSSTKTLELPKDALAIVDSHLGLFPPLLEIFNPEIVHRVYIENFHGFEDVYAEDIRLLRRSVRDIRERGHQPFATLQGWQNVQRGVNKHIKPYLTTADECFNGALIYDLAFLRDSIEGKFVDPEIFITNESNQDAYVRGKRIKGLLDRINVEGVVNSVASDSSKTDYIKTLLAGLSMFDPLREFVGQNKSEDKKEPKKEETEKEKTDFALYPAQHGYAR